jgi:hypothetical protein
MIPAIDGMPPELFPIHLSSNLTGNPLWFLRTYNNYFNPFVADGASSWMSGWWWVIATQVDYRDRLVLPPCVLPMFAFKSTH